MESLISNSVEIFLNLVSDRSFDRTSVFTLSLTVRITPTKILRFKREKPPSQCWVTKFWSRAPEDTPVSVFSSLSLFSYVIWISQHCSNWCKDIHISVYPNFILPVKQEAGHARIQSVCEFAGVRMMQDLFLIQCGENQNLGWRRRRCKCNN